MRRGTLLRSRLLILGWHNVEPSWCFPAVAERGRRGLERQFRMLRRGANVVDLGDALSALEAGRPLPSRAVAITFDDGYRDNLDLAVPMLERLGLPATFFLSPALLSHEISPWWEHLGWAVANTTRPAIRFDDLDLDLTPPAATASYGVMCESVKRLTQAGRLARVDELIGLLEPRGNYDDSMLMLDWDGARALARRGFAIGSHSLDHAILCNETPAEQSRNLTLSRERLEAELGVAVQILAYPNGTPRDFDDATITAASAAGFRFAITTIDGWNDRRTPTHELRRFVVYPERGTLGIAGPVGRHAISVVRHRERAVASV
jgi:peptidoglycan/xylan/chitin deacetylase (PgdA/CDA1 family)